MIKKINILLLSLLILFLSLSAVSAMDDVDRNITISDDTIGETSDAVSLAEVETVACDSSDDVLSAGPVTVNVNNYLSYFDKNGNVQSTINAGDTVKLDGSFSNVNFIFNKKVNVEGTSSCYLSGCTIKLLSGASGSVVSNLIIKNSADYAQGVCLDGADNCVVKNCFINNTGQSAYAVALGNNANNNQIINNQLSCYGETYGHNTRSTPPLVLFGSHYNYIANNNLQCDDANGIYFSNYGGGPFTGGESNYNTVFNNTVKYNVLPTSWSYGIQIMGSYNTIDSNIVIGAYRGISTSTSYYGGNNITNNRIINLIGRDFSSGKSSGGENAIVGTYNSIIRNNRVENASIMASGTGISALDNSIVENNFVEITNYAGKGINAHGSNIIVRNNNITTLSGAGIFQQSGAQGLVVENNNITSSSGIGVLIKKESNKVMPSNVTIRNNLIYTGATYIVDAADVDADSQWIIENNKKGLVLTPSGTYDFTRPVYEFNGTVHTITPENYGSFIDDNGNFKSEVIKDSDILCFVGNFVGKEIKVNQPVKITGDNPVFYNTTFNVISGGVWIENLTIINEKSKINNWGILVNKVDDGVTIFNNNITVVDLKSAYSVYIVGSSYVDVINNTLSSSGDFLTFTLLAYSAYDCRFINNTVNTWGTGEVYKYNDEYCLDGEWVCIDGRWYCLDGEQVCIDGQWVCLDGQQVCIDGSCVDGSHVVPEIQRTYGILMLYSSNCEVSRNKVNVSSKLNSTYPNIGNNSSTNTIIGIDLYYNCHENIFTQNEVFVKGNDNYIYGMGVLGYYTGHNAPDGEGATNNQFIDNKITLEGTYFATGIIVGDESEGTIVRNNIIDAKTTNVTYGITLELSHKSTVENNKITLNSDIVYGIEAEISNTNKIYANNFNLNGKRIYAIALGNAKNNNIEGNLISANSNGENLNFRELDSIKGDTSGILLVGDSSNNDIMDNNISINKGYAVNLEKTAVNNTISNNYLISEMGNANKAVNASEDNSVFGNYIYILKGTISNVIVQFLEYGYYNFTAVGNVDGAVVDFYVGDYYIGSSVVNEGKTSLKYRLDEEFTPANYVVNAVVTLEDYKTLKLSSELLVTQGNLNVDVTNISVKDGLNGRFTAKVTNAFDNPVSGATVVFYRGSQPIGSAVTDSNGIATKVIMVPKTLTGTFDIKAKVSNLDYYLDCEGMGKLTILDLAPVKVNVNTKLSFNGILATLTDNNDFVLSNQKVILNIGKSSFNVKTDSNGQIMLPDVKSGTYSSEIIFDDGDVYESVRYSFKITVLAPLNENKDFNVYYGSTVNYKVRVVGADGNYVGAGKNVVVNLNGKTYNIKTDKNGYASKSIKLGVGKYTITAQYNGFKVSNMIIVNPTLSAKNIVKKKAKKIKFSAKLVDKNGKILKSKKITFKIKNKKYVAKTNKKGIATVNLKNLKVGKYIITSSYGGCTIKNTIKIKK